MASEEDVRWAGVKASAARWFARLDAEEQRREAVGELSGPRRPPVAVADPRHVIAVSRAPTRSKG